MTFFHLFSDFLKVYSRSLCAAHEVGAVSWLPYSLVSMGAHIAVVGSVEW